MEDNFQITKAEFDSLYSNNILKSEYDRIIQKIEKRVWYIWTNLLRISKRSLKWWDFDTELNEDSPGYFSPTRYKERIRLIGEFSRQYEDPYYYEYSNSFPTEFLWTNDEIWQSEVLKNIGETITKQKLEKQEAKEKREALKLKKAEMKAWITSKLTAEELKFITFK
jgi:hypothetical protein